MRLYIKYMVSLRCKMFVKAELAKLGLHGAVVDLGVVEIPGELSHDAEKKLQASLSKVGLELQVCQKTLLAEKIRKTIIDLVYSDELPKVNYSDYLSEQLNCNYSCLSTTFSEITGIGIQHFVVLNKVERVKDLVKNSELTLTEIAYKLNYSSVAHLSNQFKKNTGVTPSAYKQIICERESCRNSEVI